MTPIPQDAQRAYVIDVYTEFLVRTDQPATRIMTAIDYGTVYGWLKAGIPFRVVLRGFRETAGRGNTLAYYDKPIREAYANWRKAVPSSWDAA